MSDAPRKLAATALETIARKGSVTSVALAELTGCMPEAAANALLRLYKSGVLTRTQGDPIPWGRPAYVYRMAEGDPA